MLFYLAALFVVLGIVSAIDAIMSTRTSQGAIAWSIFLVTFPYVGVPAYWIFGRSRFRGYVDVRTTSDSELSAEAGRLVAMMEPHELDDEEAADLPLGLSARRLAGLPYLTGNEVELLIDGDRTFESIIEGIGRATDYVLVQFFIVRGDEIGTRLRDALVERARAGVRVYFLYDEIGSHSLGGRWLDVMRSADIEVSAFHTRRGARNRFQINFRNHRKLVVVDGHDAWVGGHNVGDEYLGRDPDIGRWRDTHVRIAGPAVGPLQFSFLQDWYWATDRFLGLDWATPETTAGPAPVLPVVSGPSDALETASLMYAEMIHAARERVWIASPYFVPDPAVVKALQLAALRGVDVRVLIPDQRDHLGAWLAAFAYQSRVAPSGVHFRRYKDGFMHQKVVLVDDRVASVGTANFDNRSFRLNFELTALVAEAGFVAEVERMLEEDFGNADPMPDDTLARKPFWFRFAANVARLTAPIQ